MANKTIDFFIVGYPRSGTTMVASLFDRNPEIYVSPETHFFRNFLPSISGIKNKKDIIQAFINNARLSDLGLSGADLAGYTPEKHEITWLLDTALQIKARESNKTIIGEKTPAHMLYYKDILRYYPAAKFIVILRDGRDCIFSNIKEKWTSSNPVKHAAEWNLYMDNFRELAKTNMDRVMAIRYEDILEKPDENIRKMIEFIGTIFDPRQLEKVESQSVIPDWEKSWKAKALEAPDRQNRYKWKKHQDKQMINVLTCIMRENLREFSYDISLVASLSIWQRLLIHIRYFIYMPYVYPLMKKMASGFLYKYFKKLSGNNNG